MARYCTVEELQNYGLSRRVVDGMDPEKVGAALDSASALIDSYLRSRFKLPLTAFGNDIREAAGVIAAWRILRSEGFDPTDPANETIRRDFEDKIKWLQNIASGIVTPEVTDASSGAESGVGVSSRARVVSNASRGWQGDSNSGAFSGKR